MVVTAIIISLAAGWFLSVADPPGRGGARLGRLQNAPTRVLGAVHTIIRHIPAATEYMDRLPIPTPDGDPP